MLSLQKYLVISHDADREHSYLFNILLTQHICLLIELMYLQMLREVWKAHAGIEPSTHSMPHKYSTMQTLKKLRRELLQSHITPYLLLSIVIKFQSTAVLFHSRKLHGTANLLIRPSFCLCMHVTSYGYMRSLFPVPKQSSSNGTLLFLL
jgi:hypothetical protein